MRGRDRVAVAAVTAVLLWAGLSCGSTSRPGAYPPAGTWPPSQAARARATSTATVAPRASTTAPVPTTPPTTAAPTTPPPPPTTKPPPPLVAGAGVAIGDSVLEDVQLYAPATLVSHNIAINAAVGRQWSVGVGILSSMHTRGKLPPVVIVALGSNGRVSDAQFDQMMQACAGAKRVVFMTVTGPLIGNNPVIASGVARYPTAALADWNTLASAHPDWFAPDHVHIGPAGAAALGNLLASVS